MDVPVHPLGRFDHWPLVLSALANGLRVLIGNQFLVQQAGKFVFEFRRINAGQVILHLFPHEHRVGADINNAALLEQPCDEFLDFRIDQRLPAANRNHRRIAFVCRSEAILQAHHVLEAGGIFTNASAPGASQVARVERFQLQDQRELRCALDFVPDNVSGNFDRQRERKSHRANPLEWELF